MSALEIIRLPAMPCSKNIPPLEVAHGGIGPRLFLARPPPFATREDTRPGAASITSQPGRRSSRDDFVRVHCDGVINHMPANP